MRDLIGLQSFKPISPPRHRAEVLNRISTPLKQQAWQQQLARHPDKTFADYIINGISEGFRIGFNRAHTLKATKANMKSAREHPEFIGDYLSKELSKGRTIELHPLDITPTPISKFGVIPKKHQPGQWRLIVDLSSPDGRSVNDGIDRSLCSLRYIKVEDVARQVLSLGKGTLMAKTDIKSAFRTVPVHPDDRLLLGMKWEGKYFADATLPFGLRSAPKIFNAVADALQWVIQTTGLECVTSWEFP